MKRLIGIGLLMTSACLWATDWQHSFEIEQLFADADVRGTFVLYDVTENKFIGFDRQRAEARFVPASTFKIPHTLIGLAEDAVKNVDEVLPYGGEPQPFSSWEKDMSLRDALPISNVPVYQSLARRITSERMSENLALLAYGNGDAGAVVDRFWLDGPLTISAVEQVTFLAKLAQDGLPYSAHWQAQVREITRLEQRGNGTLYGKTGWTTAHDPAIGWWVGWVVKEGKVYSFALNMDMPNSADAHKRVELGRKSLAILGVF